MRTIHFQSFLIVLALCGTAIPSKAQESAEPFLGAWALSLDYDNNHAGWLELKQADGYLDASLLWRWASVYPIDYAMIQDDVLRLFHGNDMVRKTEEGERKLHPVQWYEIHKVGEGQLVGWAYFPKRDGLGAEKVVFTGKRIPPEGPPPQIKNSMFGEEIQLLNGKDLQGWELNEKGASNGWSLVDGVLVNNPVQKEGEAHIHYGNLRTTATFEDFKLKLEVNVPEGSNSGVYLRGIYEIQIMDSYGGELDSHHMGGLYSRIAPSESAEKPAGEWQEMEMILYKRYLTVILNGKTIIDQQPVRGVTGGALTSDQFSPGPILLQGDHGKVSYRKLVLTPIVE